MKTIIRWRILSILFETGKTTGFGISVNDLPKEIREKIEAEEKSLVAL